MKISYHRRRKIKTRRIALRDLILRGINEPKDLAKELKVTLPTIKRDLEALRTMREEDLTFQTKQTSQEILDKKDLILKMLDDENYYNENGDLNISKITKENPKLEVITSVKKFSDSSKDKATKQLLEIDIRATDVYTLAYQKTSLANMDYTNNIIIQK